ncbi:ABC transporter substrate-binding protein [Niveibacterium sp. 24ML]|uniref:ABC transporter substrate-binding protein n=1 Tax=Niveibacterium sp. 24ML TaxID=2985512 RepID=UPI0022705FB2|nr:ABC transporter substrate-binding protein [Niveibacterium sp. 24ML]MCX9156426.1 ABC transporter substrate-binding protein [Niveibacterium sp. 24ML]
MPGSSLLRALVGIAGALAFLCASGGSAAQTARPAAAVGVSLPLSGVSAEIGLSFLDGFKACLAADPVGRALALRVSDETEAELAAEDLKGWEAPGKDGVLVLTGFFSGPASSAAVKRANAAKIPLVAPMSGGAAVIGDGGGWVFPIRSPDKVIVSGLVAQGARLGIKRLAVLATRDAEGVELVPIVRAAAAANGVQLVAIAEAELGSVELDKQAAAILNAKPEGVIALSGYQSTADLFLRLRKAGFAGQLLAFGDVGSRPLTRLMGATVRGVGIGLAVPSPANQSVPLARDLDALMRKAGKTTDEFTFEGCMAARVIVDAMRKSAANPTRESLRKALESSKTVDVGGVVLHLQREDRDRNAGELVVLGTDGRILH